MVWRVFFGERGKERDVRKERTFWGALCSENQDVPGSSSSFRSESESASASESAFSVGSLSWGLSVMWARVLA